MMVRAAIAATALLWSTAGLNAQSSITTNSLDIETIGNVATAPLKWSGKLLFSVPREVVRDGKRVVEKRWSHCSAQFIAPRIVITAAHCVQNQDGTWFDANDRYFLLQYQSGSFTRSYRVLCTVVPLGWAARPDPKWTNEQRNQAIERSYQWDFALLQVDADSLTGHYQVRSDWWGQYRVGWKTGYPAGVLAGEVVQYDEGMLMRGNDIPYFFMKQNQVALLSWNPNVAGGSSGGALVANYSAAENRNNNILLSVVSHGWTRLIGTRPGQFGVPEARVDLPAVTFFPMLQTAPFRALFNQVSAGCN